MVLSYSTLEAGFEFPPASFTLDPALVTLFLKSVGDASPVYHDGRLAPPMAVAARAMTALSETVGLPPGSIHTSQELAFSGPVAVGETLTSHARISRAQKRGKFHIIAVDYDVRSRSGATVLTGRTSFMLPAAGETP